MIQIQGPYYEIKMQIMSETAYNRSQALGMDIEDDSDEIEVTKCLVDLRTISMHFSDKDRNVVYLVTTDNMHIPAFDVTYEEVTEARINI